MPDTGRILTFDPIHTPPHPDAADIPDRTAPETLAALTQLFQASEQNPVTQLAGYLIADDPTYLPEGGHARALARRIGRDKLLETLIELYLTTSTPPSDNV